MPAYWISGLLLEVVLLGITFVSKFDNQGNNNKHNKNLVKTIISTHI